MQKYLFLVAALALIVIVGAVLYVSDTPGFLTFAPTATSTGTTATTTEPVLLSDAYPLYPGVDWGTPYKQSFLLATTSVNGYEVDSDFVVNTMSPASIFSPFEDYYQKKLTEAGWEVDNSLAAGGPTGGQTAYRKGADLMLVIFTTYFQKKPENAPAECPCNVTLTLISSSQ